MTKDDIKTLIKQVISDMAKDYGIATEISAIGPGNVTANVSGYDGPLGTVKRKKLKDFEFTEEEDEKDAKK